MTSQSRCRGFSIVSLHEAKAFRRRHRIFFRPPERNDTSAGDHLETTLLVGRTHVATVDAHRHGTVGKREFGDCLQSRKISGFPFFSQLLLDTFGHGL